MFCSNCGAQLPDGSAFCSKCGSPVARANPQSSAQSYQQPSYQQQSYQQPSYQQQSYQQPSYQQPSYQQPSYQQQSYQQPSYQQQPVNLQQGMGWYKFVINFMLFFSALMNFSLGICYITGSIYDIVAKDSYGSSFWGYDSISEMVYSIFPELQTIDIIYGVLAIGIAVFAILTRIRLKNFCKNGPAYLYTLYGAVTAVTLLYIIIVSSIIGTSAADSSTITSMVIGVAMLIVNVIYFGNRKHMFVN